MSASKRNWWALAGAVVLLFLYVSMHLAFGFAARFGGPAGKSAFGAFLYVAPFEHMFWLCHFVLVVPAALLLAVAFGHDLRKAASSLVHRFDQATSTEWKAGALTYGLILTLVAYVGRDIFLLNLPVTDDENAVKFGARVLARGELCADGFGPRGAFNELYLYARDGCVTSMDYFGTVVFRALSLVTHADAGLYALMSGVTGVAVAYAAQRLFGARGALLAAVLWLFSPMVGMLSMTTHGHVASRGFLALSVACFARLFTARASSAGGPPEEEPLTTSSVLAGLFTGLAFATRPIETTALLGPLVLARLWRAARAKQGRSLAWMVLGAAVPLVLFGAYNHALTGSPFTLPRGVVNGGFMKDVTAQIMARVPFNLGFNLVLLVVWFLGPLGALLVGLYFVRRDAMCTALSAGVAIHLLVALGHDNTGVHAVGPMHYSDTTVPLLLLATKGFLNVLDWLRSLGVGAAFPSVLLASYASIACGLFGLTEALALHHQALTQRFALDFIEQADIHQAIVVAPPPAFLWTVRQDRYGSWVLQFPHPDPYLGDDVLYAKHNADVRVLSERFPTRHLFRLGTDHAGNLSLAPIDPREPSRELTREELKDIAEVEKGTTNLGISSPSSAGPNGVEPGPDRGEKASGGGRR